MQKKSKRASKVFVQITTFGKITQVVMLRKEYERLKRLKGVELISIISNQDE